MLIRKARHGDEEGIWKAHTRAISQISSRDYSQDVLDELLSPKPMANIEAISDHRYYVADIAGEVVGFGGLDLANGEIAVLIVDPDHIRRGIGTKLMAKLEEVAIDAGLRRLTVSSSKYGHAFYKACGFHGDALRTVKGWRTGVEFEEYFMDKDL